MVDLANLPFRVERMRVADVDGIMAIEHEAFSEPWPASAYRHEIEKNELAHYFVVRARDRQDSTPANRTILAYGGFWLMVDVAHISTIASRREWRGRGLGELLPAAMMEEARALGAERVTLEVRVSNAVAQNLYRKYGFRPVGIRPNYYDDREDAIVMLLDL